MTFDYIFSGPEARSFLKNPCRSFQQLIIVKLEYSSHEWTFNFRVIPLWILKFTNRCMFTNRCGFTNRCCSDRFFTDWPSASGFF